MSDLERWRKGVAPRAAGPTIIKALDQVSEIVGLELAELGAEALVPQRRLGELADATDPDDWRTELVGRYATVSGFLKVLPEMIEFGANADGTPVLEAMKALPDVLAHRSRLTAPLIPGRLIDADVVNGPWKRLVFGHPVRDDGSVNRHAYAFCVLCVSVSFLRIVTRPCVWIIPARLIALRRRRVPR